MSLESEGNKLDKQSDGPKSLFLDVQDFCKNYRGPLSLSNRLEIGCSLPEVQLTDEISGNSSSASESTEK